MSPTLTTFLFEIVNFLVLVAALGWLFFRPVRAAIEKRRAEVQKERDEAAGQQEAAARMRDEISKRMEDLDREIDRKRKSAEEAAQTRADGIVQQARERAERELDSTKARLAHLDEGQREHLARLVAKTAGETIDRMLCLMDYSEVDHLMTLGACRELKKFSGESIAPVRVESARPLSDRDRSALLAGLNVDQDAVQFHVIKDLGSGVRITTARGLVDASSAGLGRFAENRLGSLLTGQNSPCEPPSGGNARE